MSLRISKVYTTWAPDLIQTALWLDAADASTVTTVSGAVSQWNDKSGNSRNASQSTGTNRPAYGTATLNNLNVIRYDATDDFLSLTNTTGLTTATSFNLFGVRRSSVAAAAETATARFFIAGIGNAYAVGADTSILLTNEATVFLTGPDVPNRNPRSGTGLSFYSRPANQAEIYHVFGRNTGSIPTAFGARVNGSAVNTYLEYDAFADRSPNACSPALTGLNIGGSGGASNGAVVDFAEILILTTTPSQSVTESIEGYLAHKWGLTANLPNNHPYKYYRPSP